MSEPAGRLFTSVVGTVGADLRLEIGGKGRKNLLAVVAGYSRATLAAHDAPTFYGRLIVVQGIVPVTPNITPATNLQGTVPKVLFDILLHDLGPHSFFFPLSQLEGNVQTDEDATMTIVLAAAQDTPNGAVFVGRLNCAGQTVFGGTLSGQRGISA